jgi:RimK family alpha-L-glutamate ligase
VIRRHSPARDRIAIGGRFAIVVGRRTRTNQHLVDAARRLGWDASMLRPTDAVKRLRPGDIPLGRLDVLPTMDGIEPGIESLRELERRGLRVVNGPATLHSSHDKLTTALRLGARGLPHPRTVYVDEANVPELDYPVVVKPRFGSWGRDVVVCHSCLALRRCLREFRRRAWFAQGAVVQELIAPQGRDLRVLVAGGDVVGAVERRAAAGEWRTNVALGGRRRATTVPPEAGELARAAAEAIGGGFVGVDLLPDARGGHVVLEVNGAVDFTQDYGRDGEDVFEGVVQAVVRYVRDVEDGAMGLEDAPAPAIVA